MRKTIAYNIKSVTAMALTVMLSLLLLGQAIFAAEEETETVDKAPIREAHSVTVDEETGYCFFVEEEVALTDTEIAAMTDRELIDKIFKEAGLYLRKVPCTEHAEEADKLLFDDFRDGHLGIVLSLDEADIKAIRAVKKPTEPVELYVDVTVLTGKEILSTKDVATHQPNDEKGLIPVKITAEPEEETSPEPTDPGAGDSNPAPDKGNPTGKAGEKAAEKAAAIEEQIDEEDIEFLDIGEIEGDVTSYGTAKESLPEYKTIKTVAKKTEPIVDENNLEGEAVILDWPTSKTSAVTTNPDTGSSQDLDKQGLALLGVALVAALLFARSIHSDRNILRWYERKKKA